MSGYRIFSGPNGLYVAYEKDDGFHYQPADGGAAIGWNRCKAERALENAILRDAIDAPIPPSMVAASRRCEEERIRALDEADTAAGLIFVVGDEGVGYYRIGDLTRRLSDEQIEHMRETAVLEPGE